MRWCRVIIETNLEAALIATRAWVDGFVVAEHLCPFAAAATRDDRTRYRASAATDPLDVLTELEVELVHMASTSAAELPTTLLVLPRAVTSFREYVDLLVLADQRIRSLGLEGVVQIASFHPRYVFAGVPADDPANYTNRAPFPMLHLLREAELERAIAGYADVASIPSRNAAHLRRLGLAEVEERATACTRQPIDPTNNGRG